MGQELMAIRTESLTITYGSKVVISSLNLEIPAGKITVLVGPNGCGKSSLLRSFAGLLPPFQGRIYLHEKPLDRYSRQHLAQRVGLLAQERVIPPGFTVAQLIRHGRFPHRGWWGLGSDPHPETIAQALHWTGLEPLQDYPLDRLSGGQRQRAWLALLLAQDPDILLLDEPTTFLDLAYQWDLLERLKAINQEQKKTLVLVLHDLNQAASYGDYIIALKDGNRHSQGPPATVITETMIRSVFNLSSCVMKNPITGAPLCIPLGQK